MPPAPQPLCQQLLVVAVVVVRCVDEVDAKFNGAMNHRDVALLIDVAELALKSRTAKADRRDLQAIFTEISISHAIAELAGTSDLTTKSRRSRRIQIVIFLNFVLFVTFVVKRLK